MKMVVFLISFGLSVAINASDKKIELKLTCPQDLEMFETHSNKLSLSVKDLLLQYNNEREKTKELTNLWFSIEKEKNYETRKMAEKQILEIKKGQMEITKKAKELYNDNVYQIAKYTTKIKQCWSLFDKKDKDRISNNLNLYTQKKYLQNFKKCTSLLETTNKNYDAKYLKAQSYYLGKTTIQQVESTFSISDKNIKKLNNEEYESCKDYVEKSTTYKKIDFVPQIPKI